MNEEYRLTNFIHTATWTEKMSPCDLKQTIYSLVPCDNRVLVGFENNDDASVYKLNENEAIVQTIDYINDIVDDPYSHGKIAAANSLSKIFAMGADLKTALSVMGFDKKNHNINELKEILKGGNEKIQECGGLLMGGHTIESSEIFYGLSATGIIHPNKIYRNNSSKIGDVLVLTKPLGMGVLISAIKKDILIDSTKYEAINIMESLNYLPAKILKDFKVSSCTSISNLGLLGHAFESVNSYNSFAIHCGDVPVIQDVFDLSLQGIFPQETKKNMERLKKHTTIMCSTNDCYLAYCDAQVSGGLLIAMDEKDAKEYIKVVEDLTFGYASIIGEVIPRSSTPIMIY